MNEVSLVAVTRNDVRQCQVCGFKLRVGERAYAGCGKLFCTRACARKYSAPEPTYREPQTQGGPPLATLTMDEFLRRRDDSVTSDDRPWTEKEYREWRGN